MQAILPWTVASIRAVASNFLATSNYGRIGRDSERRGRSRSHNGRFQPYRPHGNHRSTRDVAEPSVFYNDICLLSCPEWEKVPRGEVKAHLIRKNLYVNAWLMIKDWSAATLRQEINNLFLAEAIDKLLQSTSGSVRANGKDKYLHVYCIRNKPVGIASYITISTWKNK